MTPPPAFGATVAADTMLDTTETASSQVGIPDYLERHYWWAYVRPWAIRFWDRGWLVNSILFGHFKALRNMALARLAPSLNGRVLQVAAVYGDLTPELYQSLGPQGEYHLLDVAPQQLANAARKLPAGHRMKMHVQDSTAMQLPEHSFDAVLLFFLLHEQPDDVKAQTCREALRMVKPGGRIVLVDFHQPSAWHPWRYWYRYFLMALEPFALALWGKELRHWFPHSARMAQISKQTLFGGLFQVVEMQVPDTAAPTE